MKEVKYLKLKEIATEMYRGSGIKKDQVVSEGYPCVRYGEIYTTYDIAFDKCVSHTTESEISARKYFEKGDILFAITGESVEDIGKSIAYLGEEKCLLGGDVVAMKHNQNPKYLAYALSSPSAIKQKGIGKTKLKVVHTNIPSLKEIVIPIPSPEEQSAIVSKLDTAFAKIDEIKDNAKRALDEAILLFDTALNATFSNNSGWEEHRLDELCSIESRLVDPTAECFAKIPHIGGANITSTTGHLIDVKAVEDEDLSSGKYFFEENVVLYNKIRPYLKKVALPTTCGLCSADMYPLTPKKGTDREFLRFLLLTKHFTDYAISGSARAGMPKVNRKHLFAYSCYTPSLEKQKLIASNLRSLLVNIEELQKNEDSILKECETLKQAVLKQVFEINN